MILSQKLFCQVQVVFVFRNASEVVEVAPRRILGAYVGSHQPLIGLRVHVRVIYGVYNRLPNRCYVRRVYVSVQPKKRNLARPRGLLYEGE